MQNIIAIAKYLAAQWGRSEVQISHVAEACHHVYFLPPKERTAGSLFAELRRQGIAEDKLPTTYRYPLERHEKLVSPPGAGPNMDHEPYDDESDGDDDVRIADGPRLSPAVEQLLKSFPEGKRLTTFEWKEADQTFGAERLTFPDTPRMRQLSSLLADGRTGEALDLAQSVWMAPISDAEWNCAVAWRDRLMRDATPR